MKARAFLFGKIWILLEFSRIISSKNYVCRILFEFNSCSVEPNLRITMHKVRYIYDRERVTNM